MAYVVAPFDGDPQAIFLVYDQHGRIWVGKKSKRDKEFLGAWAPYVSAAMLWGRLQDFRIDQDSYGIGFRDLESDDIAFLKKKIRITEITFPFARLIGEKKLEIRSGSMGWEAVDRLGPALDRGEKILRDWSLGRLEKLGLKNKLVYDPACSTGKFLREVKRRAPSSFTIGQDLNEKMLGIAKPYIDKAILGSAIHTPVPDASVDFLVCRFLNSGVVTSKFAHGAFARLSLTLKVGGHAVLLGYTPVLLGKSFLEECGFRILEQVGTGPRGVHFQHYIAQKIKKRFSKIKGLTA